MTAFKYYLGLDMGTNSVGWAATDPEYRLLKAKGKDLWGIPAMCCLDYTMSEADCVSNFARKYTIASGGPYCDCGYTKRSAK